MRRIQILSLILTLVLLASCGNNAEPDTTPDNNPDNNGNISEDTGNVIGGDINTKELTGMVEYTNDRVSFYVPEGWKSQDLLFRDPSFDLVKAGAEVVFYPPDQEFDDLLPSLSNTDIRYTNLDLGNRTLLVFMKGNTGRYYYNGIESVRTTFYDGEVSEYETYKIKSDGAEYDACSAYVSSDTMKNETNALVWIMYGDKTLTNEAALTSFYGIAVVSNNIGSEERELFENVVNSFRYKTR
ncbi:MAG TPA: hypothetical protein PKV16_02550 [Caldisericia bacterium]|nr:hypothetical protein [Caldisericia bacterium]HPF48193.1 hypothetical protein [Caldisericia bacterium]HPI83871.1 hypothetical protein [Caldisericia bacterium]HPQ92646.1 hypothetical protein [Caldisericia bacterium]HRV74256.1 hypothetical protein [Caldisericia bacterium]